MIEVLATRNNLTVKNCDGQLKEKIFHMFRSGKQKKKKTTKHRHTQVTDTRRGPDLAARINRYKE